MGQAAGRRAHPGRGGGSDGQPPSGERAVLLQPAGQFREAAGPLRRRLHHWRRPGQLPQFCE